MSALISKYCKTFQRFYKGVIYYITMEAIETPSIDSLLEQKVNTKILATPELVLKWKEHYLREGHSVHSTTTYFNYLKRFVGYGTEITQKKVDRFRENNMSGACAGALKNFFNYLVNKQEFPEQVRYIKFDKSKSTKKFPKSIDPLEVQKIIDSIENLKDKNLTIVIYELGLRVSEGLKLSWSNFNWIKWLEDKTKDGEVSLLNTKGDKFRTIPVPSWLMEKLYNEHKNRSSTGIPLGNEPVFNLVFDYGRLGYGNDKENNLENQYNYIVVHAEDRYRKLLYKVSKEVLDKRVNPHMLRSTKALDMMNHNVPIETIKAFLGHARISSTELYASASASKISKDMKEYNEKINQEKIN